MIASNAPVRVVIPPDCSQVIIGSLFEAPFCARCELARQDKMRLSPGGTSRLSALRIRAAELRGGQSWILEQRQHHYHPMTQRGWAG
jgi:hypothetical protein